MAGTWWVAPWEKWAPAVPGSVKRRAVVFEQRRDGPLTCGREACGAVLALERENARGGPQPQRLAHQRERHRVQRRLEADMTVAMHRHRMPDAQIRRHLWERQHAISAVDAQPGLLQHPLARMHVQIDQITEAINPAIK